MTLVVTSSLLNPNGTPGPQSASFANFVKIVRDSIVQAGWVDTEASGSIDTGSVIPPRGNGANQFIIENPYTSPPRGGFHVFRMNDDLHNQGYPVYIRFDYGTLHHGGVFNIQITLGFTHDGSGSVGGLIRGLNNTFDSTISTEGGFAVSGALYDHRFCIISGGDMGMLLANNLAGNAGFAFVERTKDINGNNTNEGVIVGAMTTNWTDATRQSYLLYSQQSVGQQPIPETFFNVIYSQNTVAKDDDTLPIFPIIPMVSYGPHNPLRMFGFVKSGDLIQNALHPIVMYNTSSIYFVSANTSFSEAHLVGNVGHSGASTNRLIMRSE